MRVAEVPPRDTRPLIAEIHRDLVALLGSLRDIEWAAPTEAGHWNVQDVALHLLDGDLGQLSRGRDGHTAGLLDTRNGYRTFVAALDAKNQQWVEAAHVLSPRVVTGLLRWSGEQVGQYYTTVDLRGTAIVSWASDDPVPRWLDIAREMTERWAHQQHIRDAVGQPGDHARFLPAVLATFAWAFPHQYRPAAAPGTAVQLDFGSGGRWRLTRAPQSWVLDEGTAQSPAATLRMPPHLAWRQLTGLPVPAGGYQTEGDERLAAPLLAVRGIIV
jgi:Mycothiol maleylpyruvate isomerase N-terminal domain